MPEAPMLAHERWLAAVPRRRSRRGYDGTPPSDEALRVLDAVCESFRPFPDARVALLADAPDSLFRGIVGSYGRVTGARSALVMVGDERSATVNEHVGFTGEAAVLEATSLGLDTCWVGGFFDRRRAGALAALGRGERVYAVSPVGRAVEHPALAERIVYRPGHAKRRRPLDEIAPGWESWPEWARAGLEAAQVAPSAVNGQPWRFRLRGGSVEVGYAGIERPLRVSRRLDCGIAMLHFELGARGAGCAGTWEPLSGSGVALWVPRQA